MGLNCSEEDWNRQMKKLYNSEDSEVQKQTAMGSYAVHITGTL